MKARIYAWELAIFPLMPYSLLAVALLLLGLTHGVIELAQNWPRHFIENMESFMPLTVALISAPLIQLDSDQGMVEMNATLPQRLILWIRLAVLWGTCWALLLAGAEIMNLLWGPVRFWAGVWAAVGPAALLTGLALWATLLTTRLAVGYLVVIGLPVADLILKILGAFNAVPWLQLIDTFAYRWNVPAMPWWVVKAVMLGAGGVLIALAIQASPRYWSRSL
ncbi:MAG: hypothetical protein OWU84_01720 [Firmicutes bacterium]|nr:hypothetical protein [Bacillota bacterium]